MTANRETGKSVFRSGEPSFGLERLNERNSRAGMAIPIAILGVLLAAFFIGTLFTLNQGFRTGLEHLNIRQYFFNVAYSGYSQGLTKIREKSWNDRVFKNAPYAENNIAFDNATYDLYMTDSPGKSFQADIYVRVRFQGNSQTFFWRILYSDDILDVSNRVYPILFMDVESKYFPGGGSSLDTTISEILDKRRRNRTSAAEKSVLISHLPGVNDVAKVFPALPAGKVLPEPPIGTRPSGKTPAPPDIFAGDQNRKAKPFDDAPPPPDPNVPRDYQGPVNFGDGGSGNRVAQRDGTVTIDARCVDEKGTRILVVSNGQAVIDWKSDATEEFAVVNEKRREEKLKRIRNGEPTGKYEDKNMFRVNFEKSFFLRAGEKVKVSFVGRKTVDREDFPMMKSWFKMSGPF